MEENRKHMKRLLQIIKRVSREIKQMRSIESDDNSQEKAEINDN